MYDQASEKLVADQIEPDEELLWTGRPRQGVFLRPVDALLIPFSIMWGGFAIFWEAGVLASGAPLFFALWGVPFVLVGLYLMIGRFWVDARQRAATVYAVTSERVLVLSGLFARSTKSLRLDNLSDVSLTERRDGSGTITFGPVPSGYAWHGGGAWPGCGWPMATSFDSIREARTVFDVIEEARRASRKSA